MTPMKRIFRQSFADRAYQDKVWSHHSPTAPPVARIPTSYMEVVHKQLGMGSREAPPDPALAESMLKARPELTQDHEALLALGLSQARQGRHEEALAAYAAADEAHRRWRARITINRSASLIELGRYDEASRVAREAIDAEPQSWASWSNLLFSLVKLGDQGGLEKALIDLDLNVPDWTERREFVDRIVADVVVLRGRRDRISKIVMKKLGRN